MALHLVTYSGLLGATGGGLFLRVVQGTLGQAIDALFVISGFVVFLPTVARGGHFGSVRAYALRRAARLAPAYWVTMALAVLLLAVVTVRPPLPMPDVGDLAVHALFLQTPAQMFTGTVPLGFGLNGVVWTLSLEVTFYLLLPLVAGWYFRRPLVGLVVAAAVTAGWHEVFLHFGAVTDRIGLDLSVADSARVQASALSQFPFFAFSFAAGMTGAWAYVRAAGGRAVPAGGPGRGRGARGPDGAGGLRVPDRSQRRRPDRRGGRAAQPGPGAGLLRVAGRADGGAGPGPGLAAVAVRQRARALAGGRELRGVPRPRGRSSPTRSGLSAASRWGAPRTWPRPRRCWSPGTAPPARWWSSRPSWCPSRWPTGWCRRASWSSRYDAGPSATAAAGCNWPNRPIPVRMERCGC